MTEHSNLRFTIRLSYDEEDALWYADCLDLQGCHTFGETREEARSNLLEVIGDRLHAGLEAAKGRSFLKRAKEKASSLTHRTTTETVEIAA